MNNQTQETAADRPAAISVEVAGVLALDADGTRAVAPISAAAAPLNHECPACRRRVTHAATLCGLCWTKRGKDRAPSQARSVDD